MGTTTSYTHLTQRIPIGISDGHNFSHRIIRFDISGKSCYAHEAMLEPTKNSETLLILLLAEEEPYDPR